MHFEINGELAETVPGRRFGLAFWDPLPGCLDLGPKPLQLQGLALRIESHPPQPGRHQHQQLAHHHQADYPARNL